MKCTIKQHLLTNQPLIEYVFSFPCFVTEDNKQLSTIVFNVFQKNSTSYKRFKLFQLPFVLQIL